MPWKCLFGSLKSQFFFLFSRSLLQHFSGKRPMRLMMITYVSLASAGSTQHRYNHATMSHNTVGPLTRVLAAEPPDTKSLSCPQHP